MTSDTQDRAARRRRELESQSRLEATIGGDRDPTKLERPASGPRRGQADPFGPSDDRFAYLTRSYD